MSDIYGDDYDSVTGPDSSGLLPAGAMRAAGAIVFLGLITGMSFWAYRLGTRDAAEVPIIRAMEGPARVQPVDPGGLQAAHQGLEVNSVLSGAPLEVDAAANVTLAPPPMTLAEEDGPQGELVIEAPALFDAVEVLGEDELRLPVQEDGPDVAGFIPEGTPEPLEVLPEMVESAAVEAPETAPVVTDLRPRGRPANLARATAPVQTAAAPAAQPPAPVPAAAPAPAPQVAAAPREVTGLSAGTRLIQLGAFDSEVLTRQVWDQLARQHADLLGGKSLFVERATANARVFYRLRVAGFENTDQTLNMCEALRSRGVDCIPVTLQ
jgi:hypothetical protein